MWDNIKTIGSRTFTCGHCGEKICSEVGYHHHSDHQYKIYICHFCDKPTYFSNKEQVPGPLVGSEVKGVPDDIAGLYKEARQSYSVNAFTATVMACRKLIMHIAVAKGAAQGLKFIEYVNFLNTEHFIPPDGKEWVDHIRSKGNEANHEIIIMGEGDAEDLIVFIEGLLRFIYEFPSRVKQKAQPPKAA